MSKEEYRDRVRTIIHRARHRSADGWSAAEFARLLKARVGEPGSHNRIYEWERPGGRLPRAEVLLAILELAGQPLAQLDPGWKPVGQLDRPVLREVVINPTKRTRSHNGKPLD